MGQDSNIAWTTHTFNPWIGCDEVSPACDNCYARDLAEKRGWAKWGAKEPRHRTSESTWKQVMTAQRKAAAAGEMHSVFCASLADIGDNKVPVKWRHDVYDLIDATPNLIWLLLTKRPQNLKKMLPQKVWHNVWIGTTVENQAEADRRIPHLLEMQAVKHFLSVEPMLERINIRQFMHDSDCYSVVERDEPCTCTVPREAHVGWVICGGESGAKRRPFDLAWADDLRNQCADAAVPFFFKQDAAFKPGQRGRASDALWACKHFPVTAELLP